MGDMENFKESVNDFLDWLKVNKDFIESFGIDHKTLTIDIKLSKEIILDK